MTGNDARTRFAQAPVARLATVDHGGTPHLVPVVFAISDDKVFTAIDAKPKATRRVRRLANIADNPRVSLLVDHYDDDWTRLWWVRADGDAVVRDAGPVLQTGYDLLRAKYPQYQSVALNGSVIVITVHRWASWNA